MHNPRETFNPELARKVCLMRRTEQATALKAQQDKDRANRHYGEITARQKRISRINARIMFLAGGGDAFSRRFCR